MSDPLTIAAVNAIRKLAEKSVSPHRAYRVEGRALSGGRAVIRRDGPDEVDDDETYPMLLPFAPTPGYDSAMLVIGGKEVHAGIVSQGGAPDYITGIGMTVVDGDSNSAADNPSTTNNQPSGSYVTAMDFTWNDANDLPDGTYDFLVEGSFLGGHSAGDQVSFRLVAGSSTSSEHNLVSNTGTAATLLTITRRFENVTVSGGITFVIEYRRNDALVGETASARNPSLTITATRKG